MNNVTRFPGTARQASPREGLTTAHMFLIYSIMDLAVDISLRTEHKAEAQYSGTVHGLYVGIIPPANLAEDKGGNGTFRTDWRVNLSLPPHPLAGPDTLQQLGDIITALQQYLPTPGGAA